MRPKYEALDALTEAPTKVLDHGFVRLIDYMGDDGAIVQAARVSYGDGTKTPSDDRSLIRYLMRHRHTTPFEMCEIKFHVRLPIFVARQWMRHRMSSYNEVSGRYSVVKDEFYVPEEERYKSQSSENKQGSSELSPENTLDMHDCLEDTASFCYKNYKRLLRENLARETARIVLPLSTYTEFYWKIDLHNLMHFLQLRIDKHAQYEIRVYAEKIAEIVKLWVPIAWEAFVDYRLETFTISRIEWFVIRSLLSSHERDRDPNEKELAPGLYGTDGFVPYYKLEKLGMSKREINEFLEIFK